MLRFKKHWPPSTFRKILVILNFLKSLYVFISFSYFALGCLKSLSSDTIASSADGRQVLQVILPKSTLLTVIPSHRLTNDAVDVKVFAHLTDTLLSVYAHSPYAAFLRNRCCVRSYICIVMINRTLAVDKQAESGRMNVQVALSVTVSATVCVSVSRFDHRVLQQRTL